MADIGVIGLAVMGRNLALNFADHGFDVAVYNRSSARTDEFLAGEAAGKPITGAHSLEAFVDMLDHPRRILLMIKAGDPVDAQIEALVPLLQPGDVVMDGGNSLFTDTQRRAERLEAHGLHYLGIGISGGEEGARYGPSMMPGGTKQAWGHVSDMLRSVAAEADGEPCAEYLGPGGSGHYVKMVHNGIEYGDMQVIAEAYDLMRRGLGMAAPEMASVFASWNQGRLDSYLVEITARVLATDAPDGTPLVDVILDAAGQKGTGKWTVIASMEQSAPATLVSEAVYARFVSAALETRQRAAAELDTPIEPIADDPETVVTDLEDALYASKIVSYAQGFMLFTSASEEFGWNLDMGTIASLWRNGAITRSRFLGDITNAFRTQPDLANLLLAPFFSKALLAAEPGWRRTITRAVRAGIPVPAYSSALAFYDGIRSRRGPANLIQAQRDFFGAHTYERVDRPRGEFFHTDWAAESGAE